MMAKNLLVTKLTPQQLIDYSDNGFILIEDVFLHKELDMLSQAVTQSIVDNESGTKHLRGIVAEENHGTIRTLNGLHLEYEIFAQLCCHPSLLLLAQQIICDNNLYVHQFKINLKEAFTGDVWEWHQDYIYWLKGDGMPKPKAISVAILLDDVTEFNGPLMLVPGSHKLGTIDVLPQQSANIVNQPSWMSNVTAKLKYPAPKELVAEAIKERGLVAPKASRGSILFFDCNMLHASTCNLSPFSRRIILITYNPITNADPHFTHPRPNFLASRDFTPLATTTYNNFL
jgi:ectoine hydroxylase-related dioxygenase (phytanoyl-CoA dioxygenase family)